ncbi:hypothetical protein [Marinobacter sp.]|uniref:hypothetical protein n=1 Tax=Marinobacter sp. TaxID=50741 RepID=UPI00356556CB
MDWLRLWHDMPNDPKWRTIARLSRQPISLVQAVYIHLLVDASKNETRGNATVTVEDLASALDADDEQIQAILDAMQDRVLEGRYIAGWEKRQPKRNDDSSERVRRYREKKAAESKGKEEKSNAQGNETPDNGNGCNADVTQSNAQIRLDKSREDNKNTPSSGDDVVCQKQSESDKPDYQGIADLYNEILGDFLPSVAVLNDKRKRTIRARWKQKWGERSHGNDLDFWRRYFLHVRQSKPLTGTKDGFDWRPSFDWLLNESNMAKVIEGNYHQGDDRRSDHLREAV